MIPLGQFPHTRLRRMRSNKFTRSILQESNLLPEEIIYPIFILDSDQDSLHIKSMSGQFRLGRQPLFRKIEMCLELGIRGICLFPVVKDDRRTFDASEAYNSKGLMATRISEVKKRFPEISIIADVALDPFTSSGHDGLIDENNVIDNDKTLAVLQRQSLCYAEAGADVIAPSDMMDGRIGSIRKDLDRSGFDKTSILSYSAKYASALYGPFRSAVGSGDALKGQSKETYQMSIYNSREALSEISSDLAEGADMVMIKPAGWYLDVVRRVREHVTIPVLAYQVSGEYAMIEEVSKSGLTNRRDCVLESLISIKRAGSDGILSYYALEAARWLREV